ncbi:MAG TPA: hypothetical protein VFB21_18590 [Chthonomonadaceae bacterium]|nr:hypothetical protein [Chthonomonadaceae bacterium]
MRKRILLLLALPAVLALLAATVGCSKSEEPKRNETAQQKQLRKIKQGND